MAALLRCHDRSPVRRGPDFTGHPAPVGPLQPRLCVDHDVEGEGGITIFFREESNNNKMNESIFVFFDFSFVNTGERR